MFSCDIHYSWGPTALEGLSVAGISDGRGELAFAHRVDHENALVERDAAVPPYQSHVNRHGHALTDGRQHARRAFELAPRLRRPLHPRPDARVAAKDDPVQQVRRRAEVPVV